MSEFKVCLVSSSGGVLHDMMALRPWWERHERVWIAVRGTDTCALLRDERVQWRPELSPRSVHHLPGAVADAWRILRDERPDLVVSAGTGVAIGVFLAAKLLRVPTVWLETLNMVGAPGLASRVCTLSSSAILVQRRERLEGRPRAVFVDELY